MPARFDTQGVSPGRRAAPVLRVSWFRPWTAETNFLPQLPTLTVLRALVYICIQTESQADSGLMLDFTFGPCYNLGQGMSNNKLCGMVDQTRLTASEIDALVAEHVELPVAYLNYMRDVGWGQTPSGHMIYGGPISPDEVHPYLAKVGRVFIGDDMQGFCLAYDFASESFGEYSDSGEWSSFGAGFDLAKHLQEVAA